MHFLAIYNFRIAYCVQKCLRIWHFKDLFDQSIFRIQFALEADENSEKMDKLILLRLSYSPSPVFFIDQKF